MQLGGTTVRLVSRTSGWTVAGAGSLPQSAKLTWKSGDVSHTVPLVGHQGGGVVCLHAAPAEVIVDDGDTQSVVAIPAAPTGAGRQALALGGLAFLGYVVARWIRRAG
jgi:hypothetical protein